VLGAGTLRKNRDDRRRKQVFEAHQADLGFGLLLKKYAPTSPGHPRA
jgi:hypothetical protein